MVRFPPAAQGSACQHSTAQQEECCVLTHTERNCARACRRHSRECHVGTLPSAHHAPTHSVCTPLHREHTVCAHTLGCRVPRVHVVSRHSCHTLCEQIPPDTITHICVSRSPTLPKPMCSHVSGQCPPTMVFVTALMYTWFERLSKAHGAEHSFHSQEYPEGTGCFPSRFAALVGVFHLFLCSFIPLFCEAFLLCLLSHSHVESPCESQQLLHQTLPQFFHPSLLHELPIASNLCRATC